jgi:uncharacterized protein YbjT (DUF2867 family)
MKIAVTTPTGHVGKAVVECLLNYGGDIRVKLLGRRPDKLRDFRDRGADVGIGSQDDADYVTRETQDCDALFWVTPPGYGSDNLRAFQNRLGKAAALAIRANQIPRVVNLSSLGADMASGGGPISGLHDVEELLNEAAADITHLRAGFFFENLFWQADTIRKWGRISLPLSGTTGYPMIAAGDIGNAAAEKLSNPGWTGQNVCELHGADDLRFNDVAQVLSDSLSRKIVYIKCDFQEARQNLLGAGMSENAADSMLEMYAAVESGKIGALQPRSEQTTTPTTFAEFAHDTLLPQLAMSSSG